MPSIFSVEHTDIAGEDYATLLRLALPCFDAFSLVWPSDLPHAASRHAIGHGLRHHQITKQEGRITYRFDADTIPILLKPGALFRWRFSEYPEDLTFYRGAQAGFVSVSHEEMAWILDSAFARSLPPRLGFREEIISERAYRSYCRVA